MPLTASTPQLAQTFQISDEFQGLIDDANIRLEKFYDGSTEQTIWHTGNDN